MRELSTAQMSKRSGRRAGTVSTRPAVLEAARTRFARDGFEATTVRAIARDAGVDPSQVIQFFGSKTELYAASMELPDSTLRTFQSVHDNPTAIPEEHVVRAFLEAWEGPGAGADALMAMLRGAVTNELARQGLRDFIESRLQVATQTVNTSDASLRMGLVAAMLVGVIVGRDIVAVRQLAEASPETLIALLSPAIGTLLADTPKPHDQTGEVNRHENG